MKYLALLLVIIFYTSHTAYAQGGSVPGNHLVLYKTKRDYTNLVPVVLSDNKATIVSYPDPQELKRVGKKRMPVRLHGGYFIDNAGVCEHTAFLKITYKQYASLERTPTAAELYKWILDKDPLVEICDCGSKDNYLSPVIQMNGVIDNLLLAKGCIYMEDRRPQLPIAKDQSKPKQATSPILTGGPGKDTTHGGL
jgi:hypothetical protein